MDPDERVLFARGVADAAATSSGPALDAALEGLGWFDALDADPEVAVSVLFECQGAANGTSTALDSVMWRAMGLGESGLCRAPDHQERDLGQGDLGVVFPALRSTDPPGRLEDGRCDVSGVALSGARTAQRLLVVASTEDGAHALVMPGDALDRRRAGGLDPRLSLVEVRGGIDDASADALGDVPWGDALALGQLALAHELVGCARAMLELARDHALDRVQFGRPIASFQAVRHRLADSLVAVEAAAALAMAAWADPAAYAAMAKSFAGRQGRTVARHCQQVLAGIGFTTEHALHHFVRRTLVLDQLLGAGTLLTRRLGADVLESASLPAAFPL